MEHTLSMTDRPEPPLRGHLDLGDRPGVPHPIEVTSRFLTRGGVPHIPVTAEYHYSRHPRARWEQALRKIRSGGATAVASYLFWLHHAPEEGAPRFDGHLDVRHFAQLCARLGLGFVPRIGPWVHAEARGGGLPDWVRARDITVRSDDPGYLALVRGWYGAVAEQLRGLDRASGGPVLALQIENELFADPGHLARLKALAAELGLDAPLWTTTAWGGVRLPGDELLPLYGGYTDGFWFGSDDPWDDSCRANFLFGHDRDDPGIGADLRTGAAAASTADPSRFPFATCELGGGMAQAYHRRVRVAPDDVAALALTKLGCGSNWQGYYVFHGGTNPGPGLQESHATGSPNDLPELTYDFQAPLGEYGQAREHYFALRQQHLMLADFGPALAPCASVLPDRRPAGPGDTSTLRWALRSDGDTGWLFVNNHQPHEPLPDHPGVRFDLALPDGHRVRFPHRPVTVPSGAYFCWPVGLCTAGVRLAWATAQPVCVRELGGRQVLVLAAEDGIPVELAFARPAPAPIRVPEGADVTDTGDAVLVGGVRPGTDCLITVGTDAGETDILVLDRATARTAVPLDVLGAERLVLCADAVTDEDGALRLHTARDRPDFALLPAPERLPEVPGATLSSAADGVFTRYTLLPDSGPDDGPDDGVRVTVRRIREAAAPPAAVTRVPGRASAPAAEAYENAEIHRVRVTGIPTDADELLLRVHWSGDTARAYGHRDGEEDGDGIGDRNGGRDAGEDRDRAGSLFADDFCHGRPWEIGLSALGPLTGEPRERTVELRLLPLAADSPVRFPPAARPDPGGAPFHVALERVEAEVVRVWEVAPAAALRDRS
ncbi:beta-galactosidase [Streptomyces sp. NBC_01429]|uniref:beta-galactosidase n=1 Tax=Streptomyces sp. NBC_01429 TaxID=2903862 RepID=UPI002E2873BA|nr:beta-galactosidase [Streptomyces sp. NBC_01429]